MAFDLATARPVEQPTASSFDLSTARPVATEDNGPTVLNRANAFAGGFNTGVASLVGLPVDTVANVRDLGKAAVGSVVGAVIQSDAAPIRQGKPGPFGTGQSFDVNENGDLVVSQTIPRAEIPAWLQIGDRAKDIGSGANLRELGNKLPGRPFDIPRPDDAASRYLFAAGQGASAAATAPFTGGANAPVITQKVLPAIASGVAGSEAAQLAAEHGSGPLGQVAAGVAASMVPGAARVGVQAAARGLARGGEGGRLRTAQNIQDFENAGSTPTVGQATEGRLTRSTESLLSRTPGAAGRLSAKAESQAEQFGTRIEALANSLSPKASGEQAGRAITKGVTGEGGFIEQFKEQSGKNYDALDKHIKKDAPFVLPKTAAALDELTSKISGAENTSKFFINSKISSIKDALSADLKDGGNTLPYEAVKKIRSIVGEQLADAPFNGDVPRSQWKKLYAALSSDLELNAKAVSPSAEAALARANLYHSAGMKRLDTISTVIDKAGGPEKVFQAATTGTKEGATTLRAVMQSLPPDAQKTLTAGVLRRLGRATAGRQDELGEKFSTETFLTNWNSMSPQARAVLFDRYGKGFREDMDAIARVTSNLRSGSKVFQNPSGTGQAVGQMGAVAAFVSALASGHPHVAAGVAGGVGAANLAARALTNPAVVKWLAERARAPQSAIPALIVQGSRSNDPDIRDLAKLLGEKTQQQ